MQRSPLPGRERELAELNLAFRVAGERGLTRVSVQGAPGSGKTRLMNAWLGQLPPKTVVMRTACTELHRGYALHPVIAALRDRVLVETEQQRRALLGGEALVLQPLFESETIADHAMPLALSMPPERLALVQAALIVLLRRMCREPSVLFFDDVERADAATASWIGQLTQRAPDLLLLLVTAQPLGERQRIATDRIITVGAPTVRT